MFTCTTCTLRRSCVRDGLCVGGLAGFLVGVCLIAYGLGMDFIAERALAATIRVAERERMAFALAAFPNERKPGAQWRGGDTTPSDRDRSAVRGGEGGRDERKTAAPDSAGMSLVRRPFDERVWLNVMSRSLRPPPMIRTDE